MSQNNSNKNPKKYGYHTNQMCNRCNRKDKTCTGHMQEMFMKSINHYCPNFQDRSYTSEQERVYWHLEDFVKQFKN